jgi:hypothetical protein
MPLVGGGGAGNVAGSNPTGTGTLNFIGDHAYAYSGAITDGASGAANTTVLKFDVPFNTYIVAKINWISSLSGNSARYINILQNSQSIYNGRYDDVPTINGEITLLLESNSQYEFKWGSSSTETVTLTVAGRAYQ